MKKCLSCDIVFPDETNFCFLTGETLQSYDDPLVGTTIGGRFRVEAALAGNGWARTYHARERLIDGSCTLKVFGNAANGGLDEAAKARIVAQLELAKRIAHPNVVEVLGGGTTEDGLAFVAHPARPQATPLTISGARPVADALGMVAQLLRGLGRVHDFGARHGQVHPGNVLMSPDGHLELLDVGLGRLIIHEPWDDGAPEEALAAQHYQAPEVSSGERATIRGDLYAVGVLAHELLTGRKPIEADDLRQLRDAHRARGPLDVAPAAADLAPSLRDWLTRMLAPAPDGRPPNTHQALDALTAAAKEAEVTMAVDPRGEDASSGGDAPEVDVIALDPQLRRWSVYRGIFSRMVEMGFPGGPPPATGDALRRVNELVDQLEGFADHGVTAHESLRGARRRAREGRHRIAAQMAELNDRATEVHRDVEPLRIAAARHGEKAKDFPERARTLHTEVVRWEGRSGFTEPYQELATAYRELSELMDQWWAVRRAQLACEADASERREELAQFSEQLDELREALRVHESNLSEELTSLETTLADLGRKADACELELLDAVSRFSAPMRSKPELGGCFRELLDASRS
ncbi:MAG: protein kinase [Myxococcota bacterium]